MSSSISLPDSDGANHGIKDAALLLLAGGKGLRMGGENKLYLEIGGSLILERTLRVIAPLFCETILLTAHGRSICIKNEMASLTEGLNITFAEDREEGRGPLEGLFMGLSSMKTEWGFLLGCDMPMADPNIIRAMSKYRTEEAQAVTAETGGFTEPLHAYYRRSCLPHIEKMLESGERKIKKFYPQINLTVVKSSELEKYGSCEMSFFNLNTPHDIETMERFASRIKD